MIQRRPSLERGRADHGWLKTFHTFSFADYRDPEHMSFSVLRVINEDRIAGGGGFPMHSHRHMEIITYVIAGALEHQDSLGNHSQIKPWEVQRMSAGTGISHSEFNADKKEETHLLQIWILPDATNYEPSYAQKSFAKEIRKQPLTLVASGNADEACVFLHQDIRLYVGYSKKGMDVTLPLAKNRKGWVQVISGPVSLNEVSMEAGDGAGLIEEENPRIQAKGRAHFLFFDLPIGLEQS